MGAAEADKTSANRDNASDTDAYACGASSGQDHSGGAGIIEANEQVSFPPLPCDR